MSSVSSLRTSFQNVMKSSWPWRHLTLLPFIYVMKNTSGQCNFIIQIYEQDYFPFMHMVDYPFKMNEFCCHGALFLWQLQHFMNMVCLSNMAAMATVTRFSLKMIADLIDKICYYVSRMDEPSLNDSEKLWLLKLFKCVLVNLLQNVVSQGPIYGTLSSILVLPVQWKCN